MADDCVDETAVLCEGLRLTDYDAVPAYSGEEALEICGRGDIDLILLDVGMPDVDGYEVCQRLKLNPKTADIAVIFVTARGTARDITKGYALGALDYIAKPYNLPMVMVSVASALRMREATGFSEPTSDSFNDTAYTDELTGLRNRRFLLERLQEEVEKAHRYDYPVSCMVVDLDAVEAVDNELGAASMDDLLVEVAMMLRNLSRNYDILARYDGGLFAAVLPHTLIEDAVSYASKIQREISATTFSDPCFPTKAELNVGIATCRNGAARGANQILGEAMRSLLQASTVADHRIVARDLNAEMGKS